VSLETLNSYHTMAHEKHQQRLRKLQSGMQAW
jgi:hypothetical protein